MGRSSALSHDEEGQEPVFVNGSNPNVYGTYVHGIFDKGAIASTLVRALAKRKGIVMERVFFDDYRSYKEKQYDKLADILSEHLNMENVYGILREACI